MNMLSSEKGLTSKFNKQYKSRMTWVILQYAWNYTNQLLVTVEAQSIPSVVHPQNGLQVMDYWKQNLPSVFGHQDLMGLTFERPQESGREKNKEKRSYTMTPKKFLRLS